jgi:alcohol dehydrogenase
MQPFDFQQRTRFVYGPGTVDKLGTLAKELDAQRVFVVSDPGVVKAGHFAHGKKRLEEAGLTVASFHDLHENPSTRDVDAGVAIAKDFRPELLIGLGGGSSMDCAKGINFVYSCGGTMKDYWGIGKAKSPMLPMIAVPTTAGTGSESQSFALISDAVSHVKMACGDPKAACRIAILDPELTLTQPPRVTALTGIDAITHALETFVTTKRSAISMAYSRQAWRLLSSAFGTVIEKRKDVIARGQMQLGASMAGMAIEASMLGVAHALANPLTARFGIAHGQAVGLMMPHVVRFNGQEPSIFALYADLALEIDEDIGDPIERIATWVTHQLTLAGLETDLSGLGVTREDVRMLAEDASKQWTATFNPRPATIEQLNRLYLSAFLS